MSSRAGAVLLWGAVAPAVVAAGWLLAGLPLLAAGAFRPLPQMAGGLLVAAAGFGVVRFGVVWRGSACRLPAWRLPWASVVGSYAVAAGFLTLAALTSAEHLVLRRDAGSYALIAQWFATAGRRDVPVQWAAFGGPDPALTAASPAFYAGGDVVVPQFMSGTPLVLAAGQWVAGWAGLLVVPAVLGAAGVLAFAALVARLVGPGWAPLGAALLALSYPQLHVSRSTYSEPLAQLLLLAGLLLLVLGTAGTDAPAGASAAVDRPPLAVDRPPPGVDRPLPAVDQPAHTANPWLLAAAGLLAGLATLARIDALREAVLLVPVAGWLAVRDRRAGLALGAGLTAGLVPALADALLLTRPYVTEIRGSLLPLVGAGAAVAGLTVAGVGLAPRLAPRVGTRSALARALPTAAAVAVVLAGIGLAVRPLLGVDRGGSGAPAALVAALQARQGLPVDSARTYTEQSVVWVAWWMGWPALTLALAAAAAWVRRVVQGRRRDWAVVLPVLLGSTALTLLRPAITPDHPWADRRLAGVVVPTVALLAVAALAFLARAVGSRQSPPRTTTARGGVRLAATAAGAAALLLPAATATAPLAGARTEAGERAAVDRACRNFTGGEVALLVDSRAAREWAPVLRGPCGVPAAAVLDPTPARVRRLAARVRAAGGRPVLVAANDPARLAALGSTEVRHLVGLDTREDGRLLTRRPRSTASLRVDLWRAELPFAHSG